MNEEQETVIELSKKKITILFFLALGFVIIGAVLLMVLDQVPRFDTFLVRALLIASIFLFGLALLFILKKLFDDTPGLILNAKGIYDNSSAVSAGIISWKEITEISITNVVGQQFITIHVRNPQRFLNRGHFLKKMFMTANMKSYGSPIQISATSLQIEFDQLHELIRNYFVRYGKW